MTSSVSVIIPALDEATGIAVAIRRAWELEPCEVIVVDGGSRDGTWELIQECRCTAVQGSSGRGPQQNLGARAAAGQVLLFLHADNWLHPAGLQQIATAMKTGTVKWGAFEQRIQADDRVYRWLERGNAWRAHRLGTPYGDQGIFVSRALFEQVGGFPDQPLMEDVSLARKLRRHARPALLEGPLYVSPRRWRQQGVLRQTLRNWCLLAAYACGASPQRLAKWYASHKESE